MNKFKQNYVLSKAKERLIRREDAIQKEMDEIRENNRQTARKGFLGFFKREASVPSDEDMRPYTNPFIRGSIRQTEDFISYIETIDSDEVTITLEEYNKFI